MKLESDNQLRKLTNKYYAAIMNENCHYKWQWSNLQGKLVVEIDQCEKIFIMLSFIYEKEVYKDICVFYYVL